MLQSLSILLCISLAVTPAFKMKFWNLGAEGQVLFGGLCSMVLMFMVGDRIPNILLILAMLAASILGGILWGLLPAVFKAKWGTNESLFTLMMNYIAIQLVSFAIMVWVPSGSSVMGLVNSGTRAGWLPDLFGQKYLINILIVAVLTVVMFVYLKYSKHGYEISVVGESENTARYIGIDVKKVIIRTMILSGAICGLSGFLLVSGTNHTISKELAGGNGFTAIMVSWLAKFNPIMMILTSLLVVFLQRGAGEIATKFNLNTSLADILTGIIIFFIIGCEFFINYKIMRTNSGKEEK
ncbi:MAG: ABC transporter permease, partial [Clostridia bacterium]|nr:ABC transporter permease [Clostridia bacterium]